MDIWWRPEGPRRDWKGCETFLPITPRSLCFLSLAVSRSAPEVLRSEESRSSDDPVVERSRPFTAKVSLYAVSAMWLVVR
jgi:hypothetical protein